MIIPTIPKEQVDEKKSSKKAGISIPTVPASAVTEKGKGLAIPTISGEKVTEFKVRTKRVPTGAKAVIPTGDTCCTKVCTILNERIQYLADEIGLRQEELDSMGEGHVLETLKVVVAKKGEIKRVREKGGKIATEIVDDDIKFTVLQAETRRKLKRQHYALVHQLSGLKNLRYEMLEKGSCKCVEQVKFANIEIPDIKIPEHKTNR